MRMLEMAIVATASFNSLLPLVLFDRLQYCWRRHSSKVFCYNLVYKKGGFLGAAVAQPG